MSESRPRKKRSVLARQKPKRTAKQRRLLAVRLLAGIAITTLIIGLGFGGFYYLEQNRPLLSENPNWHIQIKVDDQGPLEPLAFKKIHKIVLEHLAKNSRQALADAAKKIKQDVHGFEKVHFIQTGLHALTVHLVRRTMAFCVEADTLRLVSTQLSVYEKAKDEALCPKPIIRGVFGKSRNYYFKPDQTLHLTTRELATLQDARTLMEKLKAESLTAASIHYDYYRGYTIQLFANDTEVAVGHKPFDEKLAKLISMLKQLNDKGQVAARIELDYQNKAFVKLKKL